MAHRTKQDKSCAHTKQKHKHMASKTKSLAMCKTGHEHAANENTHKPRVHTKHDKQESTQPVKNTSCVQHSTRQNKRKHTAEKRAACNKTRQRKSMRPNPKRMPNKMQHTWTDDRTARANSRPHAPTARLNMERECPNPDTKPKQSLNTT